MKAADLARRDGWFCWLCEGAIDPALPANSRHGGTVDHVVPRSRGGKTEAGNLRLAHRICNGRRADTLPELTWPAELYPLDASDLWTTIARLVKRPGSSELAALFPTEELARAGSVWAVEQACAFVGGEWQGWVEPVGAGHACAVHLSVVGAVSPGRPKVANARRR